MAEAGHLLISTPPKPVSLLLVVDKSASMAGPFDVDPKSPDKWSVLGSAINEAFDDSRHRWLGLILFPYDRQTPIALECLEAAACCAVPAGEDAVNVPLTQGEDGVKAVLAALEATSPGGGTPTAAALARAHHYFSEAAGSEKVDGASIILITDGAPNCNESLSCDATSCTIDMNCPGGDCCADARENCIDDLSVSEQLLALRNAGVNTFVVGLPGTEAYTDTFDRFALEGGQPNTERPYHQAVAATDGVDGLAIALRAITAQLPNPCVVGETAL
jgi:hypothetical protein